MTKIFLMLSMEKKKMEEEAEAKKVEGTTQTGEEIENPPLGPGGLNPIEVFESLPEEMQTAFESGDVEALREYVNGLSMKDAKFYMRRMVDSGSGNRRLSTSHHSVDRMGLCHSQRLPGSHAGR